MNSRHGQDGQKAQDTVQRRGGYGGGGGGGQDNRYPGGRNVAPASGGVALSGESELLRQLIEKVNTLENKVDTVNEAVAKAATRDDLRALVPRDSYDIQRSADTQQRVDTSARITKMEADMGALKDEFHRYQLADARQFGDVRLSAAQASTASARGDTQNQQYTFDNFTKILFTVIAILGTGVVSLLSIMLSHLH